MKKIIAIILIFLLVIATSVSTFAWLYSYIPQQVQANAQIITQYFDHGSGTQQDPYVITRPIHFYHLVELYQLKAEIFAEPDVYYQIGYDINNDGTPEVYNYDASGNPLDGYSTTLNMASYATLLPIGTSVTPFNGHYDGNGLTVDNITVEQAGLCDVGIFGYVAENATITNSYFDHVTIHADGMVLYSDDCDSTTDAEHFAHTDNVAYIGYLVGHLQVAESVNNCFVNNCRITGSVNVDGVTNKYG